MSLDNLSQIPDAIRNRPPLPHKIQVSFHLPPIHSSQCSLDLRYRLGRSH